MPTKPKKKSIYSRKLKDITGDGKRNLADTYLGDLIGLDGKVGIKKGRPGLKASLKGARREDGTTKKPAAKKKTELTKVKPGPGPKTRRKPNKPKPKKTPNPNLKPNRNGVDKAPPGHGLEVSPKQKRQPGGQQTDAKTNAQIVRNMNKITFKEWEAMSRKQRRDVGLPTTPLQMRFHGKTNFKKPVPRNRGRGSK